MSIDTIDAKPSSEQGVYVATIRLNNTNTKLDNETAFGVEPNIIEQSIKLTN